MQTWKLANRSDRFPLGRFLAIFALCTACSGNPQLETSTAANPALLTSSPAPTAEHATVVAAQGPYEFRVGERPDPVTPEGMTAIVVPVIENKVAPVYTPSPLMPGQEGIYAADVPRPANPNPRSRGRGYPVRPESAPSPTPTSADPVPGDGPPVPLAPPLTTSFDSTFFDENSALSGSVFIPPDSHAAAGLNHVVNVVNTTIRFHTKAGATTFHTGLASFFAPLVPANATFDPKVIYDQFEDRFVVVTLEVTDVTAGDPADTSRILIAVSDDGDPNGVWYLAPVPVVIATTPTCAFPVWADYPGFAVDEEAVYITNNLFGFFTNGGPYCGTRLWIVDKGVAGGFYAGAPAVVSAPLDLYAGGGAAATSQPAHVFCTPGSTCPATTGTYIVSYSGLTDGTSEYIQSVRVDTPLGVPAFSQQFLLIADLETPAGAIPSAPQSGSTFPIATNNSRALNAVWRDDDSLWMTTTISPNAATSAADVGEATATWLELDTTVPGAITSTQFGVISGDTDIAADTHTFFPSIAVNDSGDVAIGFSASAPTIFPGSYFTTRKAGDAAGFTTPALPLRVGLDTYERTFDPGPDPVPGCTTADSRWGDYSGISVDPFDQCFWVYNEHAIARGLPTAGVCGDLAPAGTENGRWGTAHGYFCESCPTNLVLAPTTTVSGTETEEARDSISSTTLTVDSGGDLTLTSAVVSFANGLEVNGKLTVINGPCS